MGGGQSWKNLGFGLIRALLLEFGTLYELERFADLFRRFCIKIPSEMLIKGDGGGGEG